MLHDPKRSFSLVERLRMARDVAQGMSWLHLSVPMIVHRYARASLSISINLSKQRVVTAA